MDAAALLASAVVKEETSQIRDSHGSAFKVVSVVAFINSGG